VKKRAKVLRATVFGGVTVQIPCSGAEDKEVCKQTLCPSPAPKFMQFERPGSRKSEFPCVLHNLCVCV